MNQSDYLKDLQDFEQRQGAGRIATIAVQFFATLDRLPHLKREIDAICQPRPGVDYDEIATSLEQRLDKAANLLARLDLLPREIRQSLEVEEIVHGLQNAMTLRTIDTWAAEFDGKCNKAGLRIDRERTEAEHAEQKRLQELRKAEEARHAQEAALRQREQQEKEEAERRRAQEERKAEEVRRAEAAARLKREEREREEAKRVLIIENNLLVDRTTGLIWTANSCPAGEKLNWSKSLDWLTFFNRERGAFHDWRFPTNSELLDLRTKLLTGELITESKYVIKNNYWSSSPAPMLCRSCVDMDKGEESYLYTFATCYLWPVRKI